MALNILVPFLVEVKHKTANFQVQHGKNTVTYIGLDPEVCGCKISIQIARCTVGLH